MENVCRDAHDSIMAGECAKRGWFSQLCPEGGGFRAYVNGSRYWSLDVEDAARGVMKMVRDDFNQEQATKEDIMSEEQNEATEQANDKREKFLRVAPGRVDKVIKALQLLAQCANLDEYEYSEVDVGKIVAGIDRELVKMNNRFVDYRASTKFRF